MVDGASVCAMNGCVALAQPGGNYCSVHANVTTRSRVDASIHCYACGELIRVGARWTVRAEGALHLRAGCLLQTPAAFWIPVGGAFTHPRTLGRWYPRRVAA